MPAAVVLYANPAITRCAGPVILDRKPLRRYAALLDGPNRGLKPGASDAVAAATARQIPQFCETMDLQAPSPRRTVPRAAPRLPGDDLHGLSSRFSALRHRIERSVGAAAPRACADEAEAAPSPGRPGVGVGGGGEAGDRGANEAAVGLGQLQLRPLELHEKQTAASALRLRPALLRRRGASSAARRPAPAPRRSAQSAPLRQPRWQYSSRQAALPADPHEPLVWAPVAAAGASAAAEAEPRQSRRPLEEGQGEQEGERRRRRQRGAPLAHRPGWRPWASGFKCPLSVHGEGAAALLTKATARSAAHPAAGGAARRLHYTAPERPAVLLEVRRLRCALPAARASAPHPHSHRRPSRPRPSCPQPRPQHRARSAGAQSPRGERRPRGRREGREVAAPPRPQEERPAYLDLEPRWLQKAPASPGKPSPRKPSPSKQAEAREALALTRDRARAAAAVESLRTLQPPWMPWSVRASGRPTRVPRARSMSRRGALFL